MAEAGSCGDRFSSQELGAGAGMVVVAAIIGNITGMAVAASENAQDRDMRAVPVRTCTRTPVMVLEFLHLSLSARR